LLEADWDEYTEPTPSGIYLLRKGWTYSDFASGSVEASLCLGEEKMTMTAMSPVETDCISGQKLPHQPGYGEHSGSEKKMRVISEQWPCIARCGTLCQYLSKPIKKSFLIAIVLKYHPSFDPANDYVVDCSRSIYSWLTWHLLLLAPQIQ
jgi:hypothetical protein